jgi:two-component system sensor histidine kinase KdpD
MVAVTGAPRDDLLMRRAARIAARFRADIAVLHVTAGEGLTVDRRPVEPLRVLAENIGARWHEVADDDRARAIVEFARQHQITQIVIGASKRGRWRHLAQGGSSVTRIIKAAGDTGIDVHVIARLELGTPDPPSS